jgi:hypothetical protein
LKYQNRQRSLDCEKSVVRSIEWIFMLPLWDEASNKTLILRLCRTYGARLSFIPYPRFRLRVARLQHGLTCGRAYGAWVDWRDCRAVITVIVVALAFVYFGKLTGWTFTIFTAFKPVRSSKSAARQ